MANHRKLTEGDIPKHLWDIAVPASTGIFFNTMFNVVDTYFAGTVSTNALAALSISFPIFFFLIALTIGITRGGSALISFHAGKTDHTTAKKVGAQTLLYSLFITLIIMGAGLTLASTFFPLLGAHGEVLNYALDYIQTIFLGTILFTISAALNSILLAYGNSHALRNTLIVEFFLNCILDPWFLYGGFGLPPMGIVGIALATLVVKAIGLTYLIWLTFQEDLFPTEIKLYHPDWPMLSKLFHLSFPVSLDMLTIALGFFITNYFVSPFGPNALAAYGIGLRIEQVFLLPTIGFSTANLTIVGQNFGAHRFDRIKRSLKSSIKTSLSIMTFGAFCMFLFSEHLIGFFSDDPAVINIGSGYLKVTALISWAYAISSMCLSTLQALHHPYYAITVGLFRQFIGRIPVFYFIIEYTDWGLMGIWWAIFTVNWLATIVTLFYTRFTVRKIERDGKGL